MSKAILNKNVNVGGKAYAKGQEISQSDEGFKDIVDAGHADLINKKDIDAEKAAEVEHESEEKSAQHSKPAKHSKR